MKKANLLLIISIFFASFTTIAQTTATEWFTKANTLFDEAKYAEAKAAYEKCVALDNKNADAYYRIGWCLNDDGKYVDAIVMLNKALALQNNLLKGYQELGYAYNKTNKYNESLQAYNKALELKPNSALTYKGLAELYKDNKENVKAIEAYKKSYEYDNKNETVLYQLGYLNNGLNNYDEAIGWLQKAIDIKPASSTYNEIGFAYYKLKKNDESIAAYKKGFETKSNGTSYKGMGDVYRMNYTPAKVSEALECYKKAVELNPTSAGSYYGFGWCYNEQNKYDDAITMLKKSIELDKTLIVSYTELGYAQYMKGYNYEALATFQNAIKLDAKNALSRYYSGLVYIQLKDKANAQKMQTELQAINSTKLAAQLIAKIAKL